MANWQGYFAAEALSMSAGQQATLWGQLQLLGVNNNSPQPSERNHYRFRNDNEAVIFEALFDDTILDIDVWKNRLSLLFGVDVSSITHSVATPTFATTPSLVVTFIYSGTARFRVGLFGGVSATWEQSRVEAATYLAANTADWNEEV